MRIVRRKDGMRYNDSECPQEFNCTGDSVSFSIGTTPSYASLASSSLSCLGSVLIILAFLMLPEIRTGAQKLITLLSIADFFTAFGYFIAAINFLQHYRTSEQKGDGRNCETFETVCEAQSFITTTSSLCSFLWTIILAVYFHVVIVNKQSLLFGKKTFALINLISWGVPLVITIPLLCTKHLGFTPFSTANWCFIRDSQKHSIKKDLFIILVLVAGKFWEILSYVLVTILYISISISIYRSRRRLSVAQNGAPRMSQERVELRLLSIPIVFLLLRLWGTIQFFYSLPLTSSAHIQQCIPKTKYRVLLWLGIMQAIGDSGQGWSNAILYIFLSPTIRMWFICECITRCCSRLEALSRACGVQLSGYSRFSINDPSVINGPGQEALNGNATYIDRERAGLKRTGSSSSYGAMIVTDNVSDYPPGAFCTAVKTPEDAAKSRVRGREELLDAASPHQTD